MNQSYTPAARAADRSAGEAPAVPFVGAPRLLVVDAEAVWGTDSDMPIDILRQLGLLARQEGMRVVALGAQERQQQALSDAVPTDQLVLVPGAARARLDAVLHEQGAPPDASLAILAMPEIAVPMGCYAFFVGPGEAPAHACATRLGGPAATERILALYGTALVQERAGFAFRAASAGERAAPTLTFDPRILQGVVRSVARPLPPTPTPYHPLPDQRALRDLAARVLVRLKANFLPNGAVVASPARGQQPGEPNYWFFWQRDAAAVMGWIIHWNAHGGLGLASSDLAEPIARYLDFIRQTQRRGHLGTSRYTVDGEPILAYGNPQLDGPALAVLTLARLAEPARAFEPMQVYLEFLLTPEGHGLTVDPWEFVYGRTFNAAHLRCRALLAGSAVADRLGRTAEAGRYRSAARQAENDLAAFLDASTGRLVASRDTPDPWFEAISRLDMSILSALLTNWPLGTSSSEPAHGTTRKPEPRPGDDLTSLLHPAVLTTMMALEDTFAALYEVNRGWIAGGNAGWGLGRFPEDANDGTTSSGGNPWPIATLWGAQFYYRLAQELVQALRALEPTRATLAVEHPQQALFLNRAAGYEVVAVGREPGASAWWDRLLPALVARGDAYLSFVVQHVPADGGVTEQIDRDTGSPRGARDLSWGLAELIGTITTREETTAQLRQN
jgi:glucoamylase